MVKRQPPKGGAPRSSTPKGKVIEKGTPIVIPNAEALEPEEVERQKHAEKQRRQMQRIRGKEPTEKLRSQEIRAMKTEEMVDLAKGTRDLTLNILGQKLQSILSDEEQMKKVNLATLATVFGIMYDKTQLMQGLSTHNIAVNAKIDVNMNSDQAIEELNKMREKFREDNQK